jgi:glutamate synthase (NADPH/NADH) large chain
MKNIRTDTAPSAPDGLERDACALYMSARKQGQSTFGTLKRSLGALMTMGHRTGFVNGEGDGAGIQTDIPRRLWAKKLSQVGVGSHLVTQPGFWVGHLFVPYQFSYENLADQLAARFNEAGLHVLIQQPGRVRIELLGQNARIAPPGFWQIAGFGQFPDLEKRLLRLQTSLEADYPVHFCSLSSHTVVYKVRGSIETLARYYPDLQDHNFDTAMALCHARYSTNTVSTFERAQPFGLLGHNGEINTIQRLRVEGEQIGAILPREGSDSQDLDRILHTLCVDYGIDLVEAMEMVFPPPPAEVELLPQDQRAAYNRLRQAFGPYAQGPAAIVSRFGNSFVASVDALGLRPLWFVETEKEYVLTSERGAVPLEVMVTDARPLSAGEKIAILFHRSEEPEVWNHHQIRKHVMIQSFQREASQLASRYWMDWGQSSSSQPPPEAGQRTITRGFSEKAEALTAPVPAVQVEVAETAPIALAPRAATSCIWNDASARKLDMAVLSANGWLQDHLNEVAAMTGADKDDLIASLGYDGPLAVLSRSRVNLADFFKESVAVVTNPAIDHAREVEAFSTHSLVGACPNIGNARNPEDILVVLDFPILLGGYQGLGLEDYTHRVARKFGAMTIEEFITLFDKKLETLFLGVQPGESVAAALERLKTEAVSAVQNGKQCLVVDDAAASDNGCNWLDPLLAVSVIDEGLRCASPTAEGNLRRRTGLVLRSAAVRNLHDLALLFGSGADAINPYALLGAGLKCHEAGLPEEEAESRLTGLLENIRDGLEKVISTMGCHELRGYGRVCGSIGLAPDVAAVFKAANYFGSPDAGMTWERLDEESIQRGQELRLEAPVSRLGQVRRFNPRLWKAVGAYTRGETGYQKVTHTFQELTRETPVSLRHLVGIRHVSDVVSPYDVDITIQGYNLPVVIEAMSFGSQGETSFKAYIRAASQLNILSINGEGGELAEIMGKYKPNRGQQVASGRFGVNVEFLNSAAVLEIKIGQGAKPGEGGMLPGYKVTEPVARARHTPVGVDLLSPSNNHDLYSIEDLAQLIEELRMVNPQAKISVKVPVVPGIGVIAVGIAKAGADILNISGYDGGTGAARKHALQYAGLPVEIGVIQAHRSLLDAGIRHKVEIWANGGMKTGEDAVKMILLGANRVGFATAAMMAIGCTVCRECNLGTCHVGIATQIKTSDEAQEKGLKHFHELELEGSVARLVRLFKGIGEEIRGLTAQLGVLQLQDLVGRADLLEQVALEDKVDLAAMFEPAPVRPRAALEPGIGILLIRPRNSLTSIMSDLILQTVASSEREVTYQDSVSAIDRALGSRLAGELARHSGAENAPTLLEQIDTLHLRFGPSSLAGNGFAAWNTDKVDVLIEGGAQDGVAKGANGGRVAVMKGLNHDGERIDGSVGKGFAYGAQGGILLVQGNADSRACVRLSGAEVVLGGEISAPINDSLGSLGMSANLKGFACEYMTSGTVIILGDPGPYAFSGMTGGIVYQLLTPEMGMDEEALKRRLAKGARVHIAQIDSEDVQPIQALLGHYIEALEQTYQHDEADRIRSLCVESVLSNRFVKIIPNKDLRRIPTFIIGGNGEVR